MAAPRGSVYYEHAKGTSCREPRHRSCSGRWRGEVDVVRNGKPYRRRVTGKTKGEVRTHRKIADEMGVEKTTVGKILSRKLWAHLDIPELRYEAA